MKVGDRARWLIARGADRHAGADLAATRVTINHRHGVPAAAATAAAVVALLTGCLAGCLAPDNAKSALGLRHAPNAIEQHNANVLTAAGIDAQHALPVDLPARLQLSINDVRRVSILLDTRIDDDKFVTGILDQHQNQQAFRRSRAVVLRDFLAYLEQQPRLEWPRVMAEISLQRSITDRARAILTSFAHATPVDTARLGELLTRLMALSQDQREALYRAGIPAVPSDPERQLLFGRLPTITDTQASVLYSFLVDRDAQATLVRTLALLRSRRARATRAVLGLLADGRRLDAATIAATPRDCDVVLPMSCTEASDGNR